MRRNTQQRTAHWIKPNHTNRTPHRWVTFDTEAVANYKNGSETQTWRLGAAIRWRDDKKSGDDREELLAATPLELWQWVTDWCKPGTRTVVWAHNLSYDVRISNLFEILPTLGFTLEWFNLSESVSCITFRSNRGTLVLCDLMTWLPTSLSEIGGMLGSGKFSMPPAGASDDIWYRYCLQDAAIVETAVRELTNYIRTADLGNWQPTGAGMAYAWWRHKHMTHKVLVHDDPVALAAEREAMHTGRAEAWRHGKIHASRFIEYDMNMAYCRIAQEYDLPVKLKYHDPKATTELYLKLRDRWRILAKVHVTTETPVLPFRGKDGIMWPVGEFETTVWDCEIDAAIRSGATVRVSSMWRYTKGNILSSWATDTLRIATDSSSAVHPVVRAWAKHSSRALIGRLALRSPHWEIFGDNSLGLTGISRVTDATTGQQQRLMHAGDVTLIEQESTEADSSLPQVTSWIVAKCRVLTWDAMQALGLDRVVHVDTDSVIVGPTTPGRTDRAILGALRGDWRPKGAWQTLTVHGPRNYRAGKTRKTSGIPKKATERTENLFEGQKWTSVATALTAGEGAQVVIKDAVWSTVRPDWKRLDDAERPTYTRPVRVGR